MQKRCQRICSVAVLLADTFEVVGDFNIKIVISNFGKEGELQRGRNDKERSDELESGAMPFRSRIDSPVIAHLLLNKSKEFRGREKKNI